MTMLGVNLPPPPPERPMLDVSRLPMSAGDPRNTAWWGNNVLLLIETTMFGIMVAAYLYYRNVDFTRWPPPSVNIHPWSPNFNPNPTLTFSSIELLLMLVSLWPTAVAYRACRQRHRDKLELTLFILVALEAIAVVFRLLSFDELHVRWDDNAYGSVTWGILALHLLHLVASTVETAAMIAWVHFRGLDDKHANDVITSLVYWYWVVGIWIPLFVLVFLSPRFL